MKRIFACLFDLLLAVAMIAPSLRVRAAVEEGWRPDLSKLIENDSRRGYVEGMIAYHLKTDKQIRETLEQGYTALFLFDGASDNMDDPELGDISYYRVSAVCVGLRMNELGKIYLSYFNRDCSTLPDRPLSYGAWELEEVGEVGPATILDGTYELYSVKHGGKYEALHVCTDRVDDTIPAVYMTEEGFVTSRATHINIHTRTGNHILDNAMWSAGCILVGGGEFGMFTELMDAAYYAVYNTFQLDEPVGTVTIDRQLIKGQMYDLYEDKNAVDLLLAASRHISPERYLKTCGELTVFEEPIRRLADQDIQVMTLPCSSATDIRSVPMGQISMKEDLTITGIRNNSAGNRWYQVNWNGQTGYVYSGYTAEPRWLYWKFRSAFSGDTLLPKIQPVVLTAVEN